MPRGGYRAKCVASLIAVVLATSAVLLRTDEDQWADCETDSPAADDDAAGASDLASLLQTRAISWREGPPSSDATLAQRPLAKATAQAKLASPLERRHAAPRNSSRRSLVSEMAWASQPMAAGLDERHSSSDAHAKATTKSLSLLLQRASLLSSEISAVLRIGASTVLAAPVFGRKPSAVGLEEAKADKAGANWLVAVVIVALVLLFVVGIFACLLYGSVLGDAWRGAADAHLTANQKSQEVSRADGTYSRLGSKSGVPTAVTLPGSKRILPSPRLNAAPSAIPPASASPGSAAGQSVLSFSVAPSQARVSAPASSMPPTPASVQLSPGEPARPPSTHFPSPQGASSIVARSPSQNYVGSSSAPKTLTPVTTATEMTYAIPVQDLFDLSYLDNGWFNVLSVGGETIVHVEVSVRPHGRILEVTKVYEPGRSEVLATVGPASPVSMPSVYSREGSLPAQILEVCLEEGVRHATLESRGNSHEIMMNGKKAFTISGDAEALHLSVLSAHTGRTAAKMERKGVNFDGMEFFELVVSAGFPAASIFLLASVLAVVTLRSWPVKEEAQQAAAASHFPHLVDVVGTSVPVVKPRDIPTRGRTMVVSSRK